MGMRVTTLRELSADTLPDNFALVYEPPPRPRSRLRFPTGLTIDQYHERPNWWWRMWCKAFFGITWTPISEDGRP